MIVPDEITPVIGWRFFGLSPEYRLQSLMHEHEWVGGEALAAECRADNSYRMDIYGRPQPVRHHSAPSEGCACGVYALKTLPQLMQSRYASPENRVVGTIKMWGKVIDGPNGSRAQFAYPDKLYLIVDEDEAWGTQPLPEWVNTSRARMISDHYLCECVAITRAELHLMVAAEPQPTPQQEVGAVTLGAMQKAQQAYAAQMAQIMSQQKSAQQQANRLWLPPSYPSSMGSLYQTGSPSAQGAIQPGDLFKQEYPPVQLRVRNSGAPHEPEHADPFETCPVCNPPKPVGYEFFNEPTNLQRLRAWWGRRGWADQWMLTIVSLGVAGVLVALLGSLL